MGDSPRATRWISSPHQTRTRPRSRAKLRVHVEAMNEVRFDALK